jgi:hypothetical protein
MQGGDNAGETVNVPAGWTLLEDVLATDTGVSIRLSLFCKVSSGSESAVTISMSGTNAGDNQAGRMFSVNGSGFDCSNVVAHTAEQANAAATGIAYPARTISTANTLVLIMGAKIACENCLWNQISGLNEENDTNGTAGDDFSYVLDYVIQTTATNISSGSFASTSGDESQISASIVISLKEAVCSGTPTITDVDSDEVVTATQSNVVITGTGFCAGAGSNGQVALRQSGNSHALSVDSWSSTSIQVDMSGVGAGVASGLLYGSMDVRVKNDATNFDDQTITTNPPSGTIYHDLSGGLVTLAWDDFNSPSRPFGDPLDLETTSQLALTAASGCTLATDVTIHNDAVLEVDDTCLTMDFDFSRSGLYVGTLGTLTFYGCPPLFNGSTFPDLVFQEDLAIPTLGLAFFFEDCEAPLTTYTMRLLSSTTDSTTDINGGVSSQDLWVVDDASVLLAHVGDYVQCGAGGVPARLLWANPITNELKVSAARTCSDNSSVYYRTTSGTSVPGLTLNSSTGGLSGTPTTPGTTGPIVIRAATAAGQNVESPVQ